MINWIQQEEIQPMSDHKIIPFCMKQLLHLLSCHISVQESLEEVDARIQATPRSEAFCDEQQMRLHQGSKHINLLR